MRDNLPIDECIIVSPDAGGAKRYVQGHDHPLKVAQESSLPSQQCYIYRRQAQRGFRSFPQRTKEGFRNRPNGSRRKRQGQDCRPRGRHGRHLRDTRLGCKAPSRGRSDKSLRHCHSRHSEWSRIKGHPGKRTREARGHKHDSSAAEL